MQFQVDDKVAQLLPDLHKDDDTLANLAYHTLDLKAPQESLEAFVQPLLSRLRIMLGPKENAWLTEVAVAKLSTVPFRTLLVLLSVLVPQIQTALNAKELTDTMKAVMCCPPDNPNRHFDFEVTPRSIGPEEMREYVFSCYPSQYSTLFVTDQHIPLETSWQQLTLAHKEHPHRFQIGLNSGDVVFLQFSVSGAQYSALFLVTHHQAKGDGGKEGKFKLAKTQSFVATWIPRPGEYTSNLNPRANYDLPARMKNLEGKLSLQVHSFRLIGKTAPAAHLFSIANMLPALHPIALGTCPQEHPSCPPLRHENEILRSLTQLTRMLATGDFQKYLPSNPAVARIIFQEATTDHGHLVSLALALTLAIRTKRSCLTVGGVFGAGKTTSMALLTAWIILTTVQTKILLYHRENPAGAAVAGMIERLPLTPTQRTLFLRSASEQKMPQQSEEEQSTSITGLTKQVAWKAENARVLIATASTVMVNSFSYSSPLVKFAKTCDIACLDEAQQMGTPETAYVQSIIPRGAMNVFMGDKNQVIGGMKKDQRYIRDRLLQVPLGLRADHEWKMPTQMASTLTSLVTTAQGYPVSALKSQIQKGVTHGAGLTRNLHSDPNAKPAVTTKLHSWMVTLVPELAKLDILHPVELLVALTSNCVT